jgi:hypothetical protein
MTPLFNLDDAFALLNATSSIERENACAVSGSQ